MCTWSVTVISFTSTQLPSRQLCNWAPDLLTFKNNLFQKCTVIIYSFRFCMISVLLRTMKSPHGERERERKRKSKSRWHFLSFFLFFFGTMETRNTPLSLHYSVMSAPGRRAGRYRPSVAPLQAGLQFAAGQSLYNQTHSEWSVKLTHDEVSSHLHTHARTHTHTFAFGTVQSHL